MSDYNGEQVLVIPRTIFEEIGDFQGLKFGVDEAVAQITNPETNFFMDRAKAEDDPSHKQIIPYALFRHEGKFLHYTRGKSGGEGRLHAKGSIGIGGHINPIDDQGDSLGMGTYMAAVGREVTEELHIVAPAQQHIVALLNDDSNDVGKVHLGVVHIFHCRNAEITAKEDGIENLRFCSPEELKGEVYDSLETWSQIIVDQIDQFLMEEAES